MKRKNKKGQVWETLVPWIIGVAFLVLVIVIYLILSGKGQAMITFIKNLARFGKG